MVCRLCGQRRTRRACPALGHDICAVCCGTKRLTEIQCPPDCGYLTSAREHPPATAVRQQQRDFDAAVQLLRDFNQRQSQIFFLVAAFIVRFRPGELHTLVDADVAEAAGALAGTLETAARGVIYEHQPSTASASRLAAALKPVLAEAGKNGGTPFERDAAAVMRRVQDVARHRKGLEGEAPRAFIDLLGRIVRETGESAQRPDDVPRLIVP